MTKASAVAWLTLWNAHNKLEPCKECEAAVEAAIRAERDAEIARLVAAAGSVTPFVGYQAHVPELLVELERALAPFTEKPEV